MYKNKEIAGEITAPSSLAFLKKLPRRSTPTKDLSVPTIHLHAATYSSPSLSLSPKMNHTGPPFSLSLSSHRHHRHHRRLTVPSCCSVPSRERAGRLYIGAGGKILPRWGGPTGSRIPTFFPQPAAQPLQDIAKKKMENMKQLEELAPTKNKNKKNTRTDMKAAEEMNDHPVEPKLGRFIVNLGKKHIING